MDFEKHRRELYGLELELLKKHKDMFSGVKPRPIKIVKRILDGHGEAHKKHIAVSKEFLSMNPSPSRKEKEHLLLHELLHYKYPKHGHSDEFVKDCDKLGITGHYEVDRLAHEGNKAVLEGRIHISHNIEKREMVVKVEKNPDWDYFWEEVLYYMDINPQGIAFKCLREANGLSRKCVAERARITTRILKEIEEGTIRLTLFGRLAPENKELLKKIFFACTQSPE